MPSRTEPNKLRKKRQKPPPKNCERPAVYVAAPPSLASTQLSFAPVPAVSANGRSGFRDPTFGDNKTLPVHRWVPWIAGYSASFVDDVITAYLPPNKKALVLDPFCGVGTTLVQAALRGHTTLGFEINPYAALAARAKLTAFDLDLEALDCAILALEHEARHWRTVRAPLGVVPPPLKSRIPFFSPKIEQQALHALAFIQGIASEAIADLFRVAFGAVMVSFSNYSYEPSLGSRPAAGKPLIEDADVSKVLLAKVRQMRADTAWLQEEVLGKQYGAGRVVQADFFNVHKEEAAGAARLLITSPPYMNNYHYVRNTRPQLYWLNFVSSPKEQQPLEIGNFGQYWQTVRDGEPLELGFENPGLKALLSEMRQTRKEKGAYGGLGWANYVTRYFNDCDRFVIAMKRALARGGTGVIVIGNSIIQGIPIETQEVLGQIGQMRGLQLDGIFCIREKRVGASITRSSVRQGARSTATLAEYTVVLRKA